MTCLSSFEQCQVTEKESLRRIMPYLKQISGGKIVLFNDGATAKQLQIEGWGDGIFVHAAYGTRLLFDVKSENSDKYGNLFLETWSNHNTGRKGWLFTSSAHVYFYLFLDSGRLFVIDAEKLKRIAESGGLDEFPEKPQSKYQQMNDTRGRCVPVDALRKMGVFHAEKNINLAA